MKETDMQSNRRILVVDDNPAIHADFKKILCPTTGDQAGLDTFEAEIFGQVKAAASVEGYQVDSALQGQAGFALVQQSLAKGQPYALAFMDVRMPPGWDGIETTARILAVDPYIQIIICTAYSDYSWDEMITKLGVSDRVVILKKPFDNIEVSQLAQTLTHKWQLTRQVKQKLDDLEKIVLARTSELTGSNQTLQIEIAERQRTEEKLRAREEAFRTLSDNVPDAVARIDRDLRLVYGNRAFASDIAMEPDTFLGKSSGELNLPGTELWPAMLCEVFQTGETRNFEFQWPGPDGICYREACLVPEHSPTGEIEFVLALVRNVTEQKRTEKERQVMELQLRQAQKMEAVGQLAAGIAHEINTPTQYVGDNTQFLKDAFDTINGLLQSHSGLIAAARQNALTPEVLAEAEKILLAGDLEYLTSEIPRAIQETLEGVARVTKIVRAMKDFSHPGGKDKAAADLNKAIESTTTVAHNEWKYVADLKLELSPELPMVPCFLGEFNQAVLNLIINAAHTIGDVAKLNAGAKGLITIQTRRDGDHAEVRVTDTGMGIPEANRAHIFEPFFTTKDVGRGTGQGLSLLYNTIVKKHGGTVTFETEVGRGTTFIIRLPLKLNNPSPLESNGAKPLPTDDAAKIFSNA